VLRTNTNIQRAPQSSENTFCLFDALASTYFASAHCSRHVDGVILVENGYITDRQFDNFLTPLPITCSELNWYDGAEIMRNNFAGKGIGFSVYDRG
jgi:hypothetical protein